MFDFIKNMLSSTGETSSKRFWGSVLIICGLGKALFTSDVAMAGMLIGTGAGLLGIGAITKT